MNASQSLDDVAHEAKVDLHTEHRVAAIDERIFSGFLEHMGRAVYQGVFDPGSPLSDERGLRRDEWDAPNTITPTDLPVIADDDGTLRFRLPAPAHAVLQLTTTDADRSRST